MVDDYTSGSIFGSVIEFMGRLGVYDVVLPFLLTYVIFFAILERTQILGTEEFEGEKYTKRNLNSMVAFVVGFLVVASSRMVAIINDAMPNIVLLVLVSISFMMLAYSFYGIEDGEKLRFSKKWRNFLISISFIGVALVFAHAIPYKGQPWLEYAWDYVTGNYDSTGMASIIMIVLLIALVVYATGKPKKEEPEGKDD